MNMLNIFLQAQPQDGGMNFLFMMLLMGLVFYFFFIRPNQKRQKQEKNFQNSLKKGDKVVTQSGIHGKVVDYTDDAVFIETGAGKIKFERTAISRDLTLARYPEQKTNE